MTTMIALIGEQPLPNFLPVRHSHPTNILLVYTEKTEQQYKYLQKKLQLEVIVYGLKTDPYDIPAIVTGLNNKLNELETKAQAPMSFEFNLTGGTKTMSLAAYQVAAQREASVMYLRSEDGQSIIDYYGWQNRQLVHQRPVQLTELLNLREMLELHLGPVSENNWAVKGPTIQQDTHSHLFELAIEQALSEHGYETLCGVKGKKNNLDIDVMIGYQNQIGIIEAKTSGEGRITNLDGIKQLSWAMRYIKGTYIKQFLVIAGTASENLQVTSDALETPIISLSRYKRGPDATSLSYEDQETLLAKIDKVMKAD